MKLQLALDRLSRTECFRIVEETEQSIDIIEVGTGVIKEYGMEIVREMKTRFPNKILVADMKTCDAGRSEALQAFEAGADITTVMAFSSEITIKDTLEIAQQMNRRVMIDLLGVSSRGQIVTLKELGVDLVSLHIGKDQQQEEQFNTSLFSIVQGVDLEVTVAGGINRKTLPTIMEEAPDTVIIGSAITNAEKPNKVTTEFKQMIEGSH